MKRPGARNIAGQNCSHKAGIGSARCCKLLDCGIMRFFFHVSGADSSFRDEKGRRFAKLEDAIAYARTIAGELAQDGDNYRGFEVRITDDEGNELARVPV